MKIANLMGTVLLASCAPGHSDITGPPPDQHENMVLETIPFEALGSTRVTFVRGDHSKHGVVSIDGASHTGAITYSVFGTWVAQSPTSDKLAYAGYTAEGNHDRSIDIYLRDWDAPTGTAFGGPGRGRDTPSWNPTGTRIIFGESAASAIATTMDRIVSVAPNPGAADRQVLWQQRTECEWAWSPRQSATNELVFMYSPETSDCHTDPHIARATPGGTAQVLYTGANRNVYSPTWSPSGAEIAFFEILSFEQTGGANIALKRMAADGSNVRTIATFRNTGSTSELGYSMCWPGDGARIVFSSDDTNDTSHIFVATVADGSVTQITSAPGVRDGFVSCR
jgi:Tol biopolymer transport system component